MFAGIPQLDTDTPSTYRYDVEINVLEDQVEGDWVLINKEMPDGRRYPDKDTAMAAAIMRIGR